MERSKFAKIKVLLIYKLASQILQLLLSRNINIDNCLFIQVDCLLIQVGSSRDRFPNFDLNFDSTTPTQ